MRTIILSSILFMLAFSTLGSATAPQTLEGDGHIHCFVTVSTERFSCAPQEPADWNQDLPDATRSWVSFTATWVANSNASRVLTLDISGNPECREETGTPGCALGQITGESPLTLRLDGRAASDRVINAALVTEVRCTTLTTCETPPFALVSDQDYHYVWQWE